MHMALPWVAHLEQYAVHMALPWVTHLEQYVRAHGLAVGDNGLLVFIPSIPAVKLHTSEHKQKVIIIGCK